MCEWLPLTLFCSLSYIIERGDSSIDPHFWPEDRSFIRPIFTYVLPPQDRDLLNWKVEPPKLNDLNHPTKCIS